MKRDLTILVGALALLMLGLILVPHTKAPDADYSSYSTGPAGARALWLWLTDVGYQTSAIANTPTFTLDDSTGALLEIAPSGRFATGELDTITTWVKAGHTLVAAFSGVPSDGGPVADPSGLANGLGLDLQPITAPVTITQMAQPLLAPFTVRTLDVETRDTVERRSTDAVDYAVGGPNQASVLLEYHLGQGRVYVLSGAYPLTNAGLGRRDNRRLALALLGAVPLGGAVAFDEFHHGYADQGSVQTALALFYGTPWGWALVYACVAGLLFLLLSGRRFGPPLERVSAAGRSTAEYVEAMAGIFRRAHYREPVIRHLSQHFRRMLLQRLAIDPRLRDEDVARIAAARTGLDEARIAALLAPPPEVIGQERDMVTLALEMERVSESLKAEV